LLLLEQCLGDDLACIPRSTKHDEHCEPPPRYATPCRDEEPAPSNSNAHCPSIVHELSLFSVYSRRLPSSHSSCLCTFGRRVGGHRPGGRKLSAWLECLALDRQYPLLLPNPSRTSRGSRTCGGGRNGSPIALPT